MLHIICHHIQLQPRDIRGYMNTWALSHMDWIKQISEKVLSKKKLNINDYLLNLSTIGVQLDETGIMIVDRMCKLNICVLMKEHFWCPLNGLTVDKAEICLAFKGKLIFSDTRPIGKS